MRLLLVNPSNPLVSIVRLGESRWNRYRVWQPLSLMALAGLTPPEWEVTIIDENLDERMPLDPGGFGDRARVLPRSTRLQLWSEHLERDDVAVDPVDGFNLLAASAAALDAWYATGRVGPRPAGRLRRHRPAPVPWWVRPAAEAFYRLISDPDGRPLSLRRRKTY